MNINNLYGSIATNQTSEVGAINTSTQGAGSIPPAAGGAETATISTPGQFFSDLQQLSQSNPAQFKQVAAQLATNFQNAASSATAPWPSSAKPDPDPALAPARADHRHAALPGPAPARSPDG